MNEPAIFEQRPPRITAIQWTGDNLSAVQGFCPSARLDETDSTVLLFDNPPTTGVNPTTTTVAVNGYVIASNDWFYAMEGTLFDETYELVED